MTFKWEMNEDLADILHVVIDMYTGMRCTVIKMLSSSKVTEEKGMYDVCKRQKKL